MSKLKSSPKLEHYLPFYNLIDRMTKGYDEAFGYDQRQVDRVMNTWLRIVQGKLAGANEEAEKVSLADDIAAIYAFMQGMRDNGGILGRVALGICTYGYSEYLFFAMDAGEKMQAAVYSCKDDRKFGFWQGVRLGVEEYEKQLLMRAVMVGTLKGINLGYAKIHGKLHGGHEVDLLLSIQKNYRTKIDGIDKLLRSKSVLYGKTAKGLDQVVEFTNGSARSLSNAMNRSKEAVSASKNRVDSIFNEHPDPATMSPEQLKAFRKSELANQRADNEIFTLRRLMKEHGTARASGNLRESDKALEDFVYNNILQHKSTYSNNVYDIAEDNIKFAVVNGSVTVKKSAHIMLGDVSSDGKIDVTDATMVQMIAAEVITPTDTQKAAGDVNKDGSVDISDATLIQMYAAEVISHF